MFTRKFITRTIVAATAALSLAACSDNPTAPKVEEAAPQEQISAQGTTPSLSTSSTDWVYHGQDPFNFYSSNGKARALGAVNWYKGSGIYDYRRRADYTAGTKVYAVQAVGCIWVKVKFGFPEGSLTVGAGGGGTISGGSKEGAYYVSCRTSTTTLPAPLQLGGVGYVHSWLNSTTVEICTSTTKAQGPLYCAWQKRYFL